MFKTGVTRFSPALYDQVNDLRGIIDGADLGRPTLLDAESLDRARPGIVQPFTGTTPSIDDLLQPPPAGGPAGASP